MGTHRAATYYSYDIHGNVHTLLQDYNYGTMKYRNPGLGSPEIDESGNLSGNRYKKIEYRYDLVSGKVRQVAYEGGQPDQYYHRYEYDAENKLTTVWTTHDGSLSPSGEAIGAFWEKEARYQYYKHGPLARTILGQEQVQGIDYGYTLQGWLKGVNSSSVAEGQFDMGGDGMVNGANKGIARDAYGFSLNYFSGDYKGIGITSGGAFVTGVHGLTNTESHAVAQPLYNGNIASMMVNIPKIGEAQLYGYSYDQLNRMVGMDVFRNFDNALNGWKADQGGVPVVSDNYRERVSYDGNGNIRSYERNGEPQAGVAMDKLMYQYEKSSDGNIVSNKLRYVLDEITDNGNNIADLKSQTNLTKPEVEEDKRQAQESDNYGYDAIGNLVQDKKEGIVSIEWTVYGKISRIIKDDDKDFSTVGDRTTIDYSYDASGNRINKTVTNSSGIAKTTGYVRDASGNACPPERSEGG